MKVTLWRSEARLLRPVLASSQYHHVRPRLFLRVEAEGIHGYGEIAPQPVSLNGDPSLAEVEAELAQFTLPQLAAATQRESALPAWSRVNRFAGSRRASPAAVALVEMALLDRHLRADNRAIDSLWPARFATPHQMTVSVLDLEPPWRIPPSVARVRVKTAPRALDRRALERLSSLGRPIVLDFNCSANDAEDVLDQVNQLRSVVAVDLVEQPFGVGNVIDHAELARRLDVGLSLDEGVRSTRDLEQISRYRAAGTVCLKPARVGGLANARTMVQRAQELDLSVYLGGFFESPFARFVNRKLAEHCVSQPSDIGEVALADQLSGDVVDAAPGGFGLAPAAALLRNSHVVATVG